MNHLFPISHYVFNRGLLFGKWKVICIESQPNFLANLIETNMKNIILLLPHILLGDSYDPGKLANLPFWRKTFRLA